MAFLGNKFVIGIIGNPAAFDVGKLKDLLAGEKKFRVQDRVPSDVSLLAHTIE